MTLRIGVIGTGAIGRDHVRRLSTVVPGARIVAASDVSAEGAREAVRPWAPDARIFEDGRALAAAPEVDAVLVCSLGSTHAEYVLAAIAANKPVFCEKPLATTAADCRRIVEAEIAAQGTGGRRLVQVGFMRPFDAGYRQLREVLGSNRIGAPLMAHCVHRNASSLPYWTTEMAIADSLVHELDVLRWLLRDEFVSAQVVFPRAAAHVREGLHDPQVVLLETANGVRIDVELFMNCSYGYDIQCEIVGETGTARLPDPPGVAVREGARSSVPILVDWRERFVAAYDAELDAFVRGCGSGVPAGASAWDGLAAAIASDACLSAQRSGGVEQIVMPARPAFYPVEPGHGGAG